MREALKKICHGCPAAETSAEFSILFLFPVHCLYRGFFDFQTCLVVLHEFREALFIHQDPDQLLSRTCRRRCVFQAKSSSFPSFFPDCVGGKSAMPQAPPSFAVSMTVTGAPTAAARYRWPTPFVLKKPPWPQRLVDLYIFLRRISMPGFTAPSDVYRWTRMKLARLKLLFGIPCERGGVLHFMVIFSPGNNRKSRPPPGRIAYERIRVQLPVRVPASASMP